MKRVTVKPLPFVCQVNDYYFFCPLKGSFIAKYFDLTLNGRNLQKYYCL